MKTFLAALAIVAFAAVSAGAATITVDGNLSDWVAAGLYHSYTSTNPNYTQIKGYGAVIDNGTFYAFEEFTQPVASFYSLWPGAWIDVDHNAATAAGNPQLGAGVDVDLEYDRNSPSDISLNYWGGADVNNDSISASSGHYALAGNAIEWSAPVSDIVAALGNLNSDFPGGGASLVSKLPWNVYFAADGATDGNYTGGGRDIVGTPLSIPEPSTLALLGMGLAGLLAYAWRKRR